MSTETPVVINYGGMEDWKFDAACRHYSPDIFFPHDGVGVKTAQAICKEECDVVKNCLEYALSNRIDHGVWGGKSERERRRILTRRRKQLS